MGATNVFSYTLTGGSLVISASQNVTRLSVLCTAGSITFLGSSTFNGLSSNNNTFTPGQGVTVTAASTANPLDGITINAPGGGDSADVIISFQ